MSDVPVYSYPQIGDWDAWLAARTPSTLLPSPQFDLLNALADPIRALDADAAGIMYGLDLSAAVGAQLDQLGSWVDEPRGGLGDAEYRRIVGGRYAASRTGCAVTSVWEMWLALTGAQEGDARIVTDVPGVVYLEAQIDFVPSVSYLRRGYSVIRDTVAYPLPFVAAVGNSNTATWGGLNGWNLGAWGWAFVES